MGAFGARTRRRSLSAAQLRAATQPTDGGTVGPLSAAITGAEMSSRFARTFGPGRATHDFVNSVSGPLRVSAAEGVRAAVLADTGLAIASAWMFSPELAAGTVRAVLTDWSLPSIDLWAVYPTGRMPSAKARAFAAFVEAELKQAHSAPE